MRLAVSRVNYIFHLLNSPDVYPVCCVIPVLVATLEKRIIYGSCRNREQGHMSVSAPFLDDTVEIKAREPPCSSTEYMCSQTNK